MKKSFIRLRFLSCVPIYKRKNISRKLNFHTPYFTFLKNHFSVEFDVYAASAAFAVKFWFIHYFAEIFEVVETDNIDQNVETADFAEIAENTENAVVAKTIVFKELNYIAEVMDIADFTEIAEVSEFAEIADLAKTTQIV